jgi:zinc protease
MIIRNKNVLSTLICALTVSLLQVCFANEDFRIGFEHTTLPNGLTLITCPDSTASTVSYQTFITAGSRDETTPGETGVANLLAMLSYCGTVEYPDYCRTLHELGAEVDWKVNVDFTRFSVTAGPRSLPVIMDIEADRIRNMTLKYQDFQELLAIVREQRLVEIDENPDGYLRQELFRLAFRKHTYRQPIIGWKRDLERNLTMVGIHRFHDIFYSPNYCVVVVSGNFDPASVERLVLEEYGDWRRSLPPTSRVRNEPLQKKSARKNLEFESDNVPRKIMIGYKAPELDLDAYDLFALQAARWILLAENGSLRTRLMRNGMVTEIDSELESRKDPGLFVISATLTPNTEFDTILSVVEDELTRLQSEKHSENRLTSAVNAMKSDLLFALDSPEGIGRMLGFYHTVSGDSRMLFGHCEMLDSLTSDGIADAVRRYLTSQNRSVVTLTPYHTR